MNIRNIGLLSLDTNVSFFFGNFFFLSILFAPISAFRAICSLGCRSIFTQNLAHKPVCGSLMWRLTTTFFLSNGIMCNKKQSKRQNPIFFGHLAEFDARADFNILNIPSKKFTRFAGRKTRCRDFESYRWINFSVKRLIKHFQVDIKIFNDFSASQTTAVGPESKSSSISLFCHRLVARLTALSRVNSIPPQQPENKLVNKSNNWQNTVECTLFNGKMRYSRSLFSSSSRRQTTSSNPIVIHYSSSSVRSFLSILCWLHQQHRSRSEIDKRPDIWIGNAKRVVSCVHSIPIDGTLRCDWGEGKFPFNKNSTLVPYGRASGSSIVFNFYCALLFSYLKSLS